MSGYVWPTLIGTFRNGSPEWHAARAKGIGGSEVAPILSLSPWESPFTLWNRKAGLVPPAEETKEMEWGTRLERAVITKMLENHPEWWGLFANDPIEPGRSSTYCHPDRPWQIANPDEILMPANTLIPPASAYRTMMRPDAIGEAKCSKWGDDFGEDGTDQVPIYYRCQGLWYLDVFALERCRFAVLIGGNDYREYEIEYDEGDALVLRIAAEEFLGSLAEGMPPDLDGMDSTWQTMRELHPLIDGSIVDVPDDIAKQYLRGLAQLKAGKAAELHARSVLADHMGTAKTARWGGRKIAGRQAKGPEGTPYIVAAQKLPEPEPVAENIDGQCIECDHDWSDHYRLGGDPATVFCEDCKCKRSNPFYNPDETVDVLAAALSKAPR